MKPAHRPSWLRAFALRLALGLLGLAVGLGVAEGLVRWTGAAPEVAVIQHGRFRLSPDPDIGYEPVPNLDYRGALDSFHDYAGTSNSLGFRDRDHALRKQPGVLRILILGDSVAAGQGVARFEDTFPALLERELNAGGLASEVISFAVTGYNTQQEVAMLAAKGLAFEPDLVLVAYCLNDRKRSDGGVLPTLVERARGHEATATTRLDRRLMASAVYRLVRFRWAPPPEPTLTSGDTRAPAFARLAELSRQHGFAVQVVVFPRFGKLLHYRFAAQNEEVAAFSRRHGFEHLDLVAAFQDCFRAATSPLGLDSFHPTAEGHRCAARAVGRELLAHTPPQG
jgi:lysophospholipase L1-like esterase